MKNLLLFTMTLFFVFAINNVTAQKKKVHPDFTKAGKAPNRRGTQQRAAPMGARHTTKRRDSQ